MLLGESNSCMPFSKFEDKRDQGFCWFYRILPCIMLAHIFGPNFEGKKAFVLRYINRELVLPICDVHPYFSLKKLGKKVSIIHCKYGIRHHWTGITCLCSDVNTGGFQSWSAPV